MPPKPVNRRRRSENPCNRNTPENVCFKLKNKIKYVKSIDKNVFAVYNKVAVAEKHKKIMKGI